MSPSPARVQAPSSRSVPYLRQTLQNPNPVARFAHRRRHRLGLSLAVRHVPAGGTILDFGAGTGAFLHQLAGDRPDLRLIAYEPFMALRFSDIEQVAALDQLPDGSLDAMSAFEVCEHLSAGEIASVLAQAQRLLRPGGRLIISVPVMEGLALPVKEMSRALLFRRRSDYRASELVRGVLGRPVDRPADILTSHKGFAHRTLWREVTQGFTEIEPLVSPLRRLPWWMNSQRFGVFAKRVG